VLPLAQDRTLERTIAITTRLKEAAATIVADKKHKFWHCVMYIGRRVRAYTRLLEAAKALTTRDHVRGISRLSTLFNTPPY
jgi:hypothetical protein